MACKLKEYVSVKLKSAILLVEVGMNVIIDNPIGIITCLMISYFEYGYKHKIQELYIEYIDNNIKLRNIRVCIDVISTIRLLIAGGISLDIVKLHIINIIKDIDAKVMPVMAELYDRVLISIYNKYFNDFNYKIYK